MENTDKLKDEELEKADGGWDSGYYYKDYCKYDHTRLTLQMTMAKYWILHCPTCNRNYHKTKSDHVLHDANDFIP